MFFCWNFPNSFLPLFWLFQLFLPPFSFLHFIYFVNFKSNYFLFSRQSNNFLKSSYHIRRRQLRINVLWERAVISLTLLYFSLRVTLPYTVGHRSFDICTHCKSLCTWPRAYNPSWYTSALPSPTVYYQWGSVTYNKKKEIQANSLLLWVNKSTLLQITKPFLSWLSKFWVTN